MDTEMKRIMDMLNGMVSFRGWVWKWWRGATNPTIIFGHPSLEGGVCLSFKRDGADLLPLIATKFLSVTAKELAGGSEDEAISIPARGFDIVPAAIIAAKAIVFK
jgi:hypothetical protein